MPLEQELATFQSMKLDLLRNHAGKFALIRNAEFIAAFDSPENAYEEGIRRFGPQPFLIKHITESEESYQNHALFAGLLNARL